MATPGQDEPGESQPSLCAVFVLSLAVGEGVGLRIWCQQQ